LGVFAVVVFVVIGVNMCSKSIIATKIDDVSSASALCCGILPLIYFFGLIVTSISGVVMGCAEAPGLLIRVLSTLQV
jgi:hypothetical protein